MPPDAAQPPPWLDATTMHRLRVTGDQTPAGGHGSLAEMRDALWGRYPALPLTAIDEAAGFLPPERNDAAAPPRRTRMVFDRMARIAARLRLP